MGIVSLGGGGDGGIWANCSFWVVFLRYIFLCGVFVSRGFVLLMGEGRLSISFSGIGAGVLFLDGFVLFRWVFTFHWHVFLEVGGKV